ncbi:MAG TPA: hypothetical protein QGF58_24105 [Myxococcota bacterium]|nr:hypothetical protein [Myxococcota bacterium]
MISKRSKFFARTVVYTKRDDRVLLVDMHDASTTQSLEPWLGRILLLADGSHTVQELIDFVGRQYPSPPPNLAATIDSVIDRLCEANAIALTERPVELPYYLALPADQQDPELANRLMLEDGFQQGQVS